MVFGCGVEGFGVWNAHAVDARDLGQVALAFGRATEALEGQREVGAVGAWGRACVGVREWWLCEGRWDVMWACWNDVGWRGDVGSN